MRYQRSYLTLFENNDWSMTLAAGAACMAIPVVGWALFLGYLLDVVDCLHNRREPPYPAFDINRVGYYMERGLGPGLVQILAWGPILLLFGIAMAVSLFAVAPGQGPGLAGKLLATALSLAILVIVLLASLMVLPLTLCVALRRHVEPHNAWQFALSFIKVVRRELVLAEIFILTTGLSLVVFGLLLCGIGVPVALALAGFAQYHLLFQLYELYLQRGGTPVTGEAAEPAAANPA